VKVISPALTIIMATHMNPLLEEALKSVLAQTRKDLECVVADSGLWIGQNDAHSVKRAACHRKYAGHPLINWVTTGELPGLRKRTCAPSWVANQVIRAGLVRGRYACVAYDDDLYKPDFAAKMCGYLDWHPEDMAVTCSQDRTTLHHDGTKRLDYIIHALPHRQPGNFDCQMDGSAIVFRRDVLDKLGDPWLPEEQDTCDHSDGVFLERIAGATGPVPGIGEVLCEHRISPWSAFTWTSPQGSWVRA
jgi:glycosyltransferase involved in cell wall biosynthesis